MILEPVQHVRELSNQHGWSEDKLIKHKDGTFTVEFHRYMHAYRALGGFRQMIEESDPEILIHSNGVKENKVGGFFVYWIKFDFSNEPDLNNDTPPEDEPEPGFAQDEALDWSPLSAADEQAEYEATEKEREWDNRIAAAEEAEIAKYLTHEQMFGTPPDPAIEEPDEYYERSLPPDLPGVEAPQWTQPYDSDARLFPPVALDPISGKARQLKPEGDQPDVISAANFLMALLRVRLTSDVLRWIDYDVKGHPSRIQICETETTGTILERIQEALPMIPRFLITPDVQMGDGDQGAFIDLPAYLDWLLSPDRDPRRLVDRPESGEHIVLRGQARIRYSSDKQQLVVKRDKREYTRDTYQTVKMTSATFQRWQRLLDAKAWHTSSTTEETAISRTFNPKLWKR